ncbi:hypothetical protein ATER59S_02361 [Aquamicrobium terrae]
MPDPHDWTADPRPLAECLKEFNRRINGGREYGSRKAGQAALGIGSAKTYAALHDGHVTPWEPVIRLAMAEAERRATA